MYILYIYIYTYIRIYIHIYIYYRLVSYRAHNMRTEDFNSDPYCSLLAEPASCKLQGNFW